MLRKILTWAAFFVFAVYAFTDPHGVANLIHGLLAALATAGHSLANLANSA